MEENVLTKTENQLVNVKDVLLDNFARVSITQFIFLLHWKGGKQITQSVILSINCWKFVFLKRLHFSPLYYQFLLLHKLHKFSSFYLVACDCPKGNAPNTVDLICDAEGECQCPGTKYTLTPKGQCVSSREFFMKIELRWL